MKHLLVAALLGLVACGGGDADGGQEAAADGSQSRVPTATAASDITDDEVRRGCSSFTQAVANEENNEVYDPQRGVLQVYVGQQRYVLSPAVRECRENPVAMERLRLAEEVEKSNQAG